MTDLSYPKKVIFKRLNNSIKIVSSVLSRTYQDEEIEGIISETYQGVEALLPQVPYIGGKENFSLNDFFDSILMLALFKELKKRGSEVRAIGQIMYEIREEQTLNQSRLSRFILSKMLFSNYIKKKYQNGIAQMKKDAHPENWEMEFVEGNGEEFDWGVDFHDCAVRKLYMKHGGEELLPYVCMSDYAPFHLMKDVQFTRTQTLSSGGHYCDFRFKKGGTTPRAWPPEDFPDFKIE